MRAEHLNTKTNHIADDLSYINVSHDEAIGLLDDKDSVHVSSPKPWSEWELEVVITGKLAKNSRNCRQPERSGYIQERKNRTATARTFKVRSMAATMTT